jgi:hypothetical protein
MMEAYTGPHIMSVGYRSEPDRQVFQIEEP